MLNFFKKQQEYRDLSIAYKQTFSTEQGKLVLLDLMDMGDVINPHVEKDPLARERAEGKRELLCEIMKRVHLNVKQLDDMLQQMEDQAK